MPTDLMNSKTKENLMRAYAGEALTCSRYKAAEEQCRAAKLFVAANLFKFTSAQEAVHAEIFAGHLKECIEEKIEICKAAFPTAPSGSPADLLSDASGNEDYEASRLYPSFAETARSEGFGRIAQDFENIAAIERSHGERFKRFSDLLSQGKLFSCDESECWLCLNCGYLSEARTAPETCPVCGQPQGWAIRAKESLWELRPGGEQGC